MTVHSGAGRFVSSLRRPGRGQIQAVALIAAAAFAYNGARILDSSPRQSTPELSNFDTGALWLGLALLSLIVAALVTQPPQLRFRSEAFAGFWRAHRLELLLVAGIFTFGVFMRVYRFQTSLPPADGLCCEEAINGGVAYGALQGVRPLNFILTRWTSAFGFLIFGENTLGLRFFFVVMGIMTLVAFYLLLRELVSVPVALFGMALYASAWWPSLRARQPSEGTIYAVLFALVLVRALKTRSTVMALCTGVLAGLLSYEYEPFKAVPIVGALFLAAAAGREVLLRAPFTPVAASARAKELLRVALLPFVLALMAAGIVLVPIIVGTHKGYDLYLTSVHRQEGSRGGDRLADSWRTHLKWEAQIFSPIGPDGYPASPPREFPGKALLDPVTAWLGLAGLLAGAALVLRGYRGLFVVWIAVSIGTGALLLQNFAPWKFLPLVPAFIALAAFLIDDARRLVIGRYAQRGALAFGALMVVAAAFAFWWNADTLFRQIAPSQTLAASYGGEPGAIYSVCLYLRERPDDNYAIMYSGSQGLASGFAQLSSAAQEDQRQRQLRAWGDYIWACHDLRGSAVPAAEELWPIGSGVSKDLTLVVADPPMGMDAALADLQRAYPDLGAPARHVGGPASTFEYVTYELTAEHLLSSAGLWGEYLPPDGGAPVARRIDSLDHFVWDSANVPLAPPFTARWRGLIYQPTHDTLSLHALTDEPVQVRLDGRIVFDTHAGQEQDHALDLLPGWHPVEITLDKQHTGGELSLAWASPAGERHVVRLDLFPLRDMTGWIQQRSIGALGDTEPQVTQRFDFEPHIVSANVLALQAQTALEEPIVREERWRGVWHVDQTGSYVVGATFPAGTVTLMIDGQPVQTAQTPLQGEGLVQTTVTLEPGPHVIELVQQLDARVTYAGMTVGALLDGRPVAMNVTPY